MTPKTVARVMANARRLMRGRQLEHKYFVILDNLVFGAGRRLLEAEVITSYGEIRNATGASRGLIVAAIKRLVELGLIAKHRRHELVEWSKGKRFVQLANEYCILPAPHCEFAGRPGDRTERLKEEKKRCLEGFRARLQPRSPIRTVAEQLAILRGGS